MTRLFPGPLEPADLSEIARAGIVGEGIAGADIPANAGSGVFVSSGYNGLRLLFRSLGLKPGDRVAVPALICPVVIGALNAEGMKPAWVDISRDHFFMVFDQDQFYRARFNAILLPHLYGMLHPQTGAITVFARENYIPLLHDAAQSYGLIWQGKPIIEHDQGGLVSFGAGKATTAASGALVYGIHPRLIASYRLHDYRRWDPRSSHFLRQRMGLKPWPFSEKWPGFSFQASYLQVKAARLVMARWHPINARRKKNWDFLHEVLGPEQYGEDFQRSAFFKFLRYSDQPLQLDPQLEVIPRRTATRPVKNTGLPNYEAMVGGLYEFSTERSYAFFSRMV